MTHDQSIVTGLKEARGRFLQLVSELRPDLHRYCARMTGSIADGEDVVQDTLARAYYELSGLRELPALRSWLFQIAHNRALDHLKRYDRRMGEPLGEMEDAAADQATDADATLAREQAVQSATSRFLELVPLQRSCVILKDVLDYSLEEIAALLGVSVPAVKAALHRGRRRLQELSGRSPETKREWSPTLLRYAALFNARDWDGVRALLVEDVKLDVVSTERRTGRSEVGMYFTNYGKVPDWRVAPGWLDGREILAVYHHPLDPRPAYFIELTVAGEQIAAIRDFRHVAYIAQDIRIWS